MFCTFCAFLYYYITRANGNAFFMRGLICQMKHCKIKMATVLSFVAGITAMVVLLITIFLIHGNVLTLSSFSDRIMSAATVNGVDISQQIMIYMAGITTAGVLLYLFCRKFSGVFSQHIEQLRKMICEKHIFMIIVFAILATVHLINLLFKRHALFQFLLYLLLFVYAGMILLSKADACTQKRMPHLIHIGFYISLLFSALSLVSALTKDVFLLNVASMVFLLLAVLLPMRLSPNSSIAMYALPMIYLLTDLFFYRFGLSVVLLFGIKLFLLVSATAISFIPTQNKWLKKEHKMLCYCLLIVGLAFVGTEGYSIAYNPDYFEYANHALSIDGLLNFGKIPILESFDAHMLYDQLPGYLYYLLVGNASDAALLGNTWEGVNIAFYYIFVFLLLTCFISKDQALIMVLFLPNICFGMEYLPFALWVTLQLMKKDHLSLYVVYWAVMVFSALYRLDTGLCCICACMSIMLLYFIQSRNFVRLRRYLISFACITALTASVGLGICTIKGIDVSILVQRFLLLSSKSNQNWAYGTLGSNRIQILILYYMANTLFIILLISVIFKCLSTRKNTVLTEYYIVLATGIAWFVNLPRTIVRHNMLELSPAVLLSSAIFFVFLCIFLSVRIRENWRALLSLILCAVVFIPGNSLAGRLDIIQPSQSVYKQYPAAVTESRLFFDRTRANYISDIFNTLLENDETFYDFSNNSLLYPLTGRENPVYENQSPGLLSGERAQQITIAELESKKDKAVCALLPAGNLLQNRTGLSVSIDDVYNEDRYYLVAEYLYRNFVPVIRWGEYDIWIRASLVEKRGDKITSLGEKSDIELLSVNKIDDFLGKKHIMGIIPYLWANADEIPLTEKKMLCHLEEDDEGYTINPVAIDRGHGNYLCVTITSQQDSIGLISLNYDGVQEQYEFDVMSGTADYLFRVSSNCKWFWAQKTVLTFDNLSETQKIDNVCILLGDSLDSNKS